MDWREGNTGKDDIILKGGYVRGDWEIYFFHSMACYVLKINNCGDIHEDSNKGVHSMLPQFQSIKCDSVSFKIIKTLQGYVGNVDGFKRSDAI